MNRVLKNIYIIFATMVLLLGAAYVATKENAGPPYFQVQNELGLQDISIYDAHDENYYVFLPSYSTLEQVQVRIPDGEIVFLDDIRLYDRMSCEMLEWEKPYAYSVDGQYMATLWFYRSENVASLCIDTVSGSMEDIHGDKNHEEYASMTLFSPDGRVDYHDVSSKLKGRGNSTWGQDKRPYLMTLSSDGNLLNMGSASKWVLLANAYDETNLNNKLIFDLASQVGFRWSPDSQFVDLYLNGEYRGLYLLAEKIEVHDNRLDINTAAGDYLCKVDTWDRRVDLLNYFESSVGRIIEVCSSDAVPDSDLDYVSYLVYLMEEEIQSGNDLNHSDILDLDSWVRRYLIDEISGNIDSDLTSSYFYFSDGKFFAGPVWDYDMAMGNSWRNQEPRAFLAKNAYKRSYRPSPYYSALYANESFHQRMVEIYRTEFVPILESMIRQDIDAQIEFIREASQMNSIRWRNMYDEWREITVGLELAQDPEALKSWFVLRVQFLNSAWLDDVEYCTVQFESEPGDAYWNISLEKGTCLETTYMNLTDTVWVDAKTGMPVDFQKPITQDMVVTLQLPEDVSADADFENGEMPVMEEAVGETEDMPIDKQELLYSILFIVMFSGILLTEVSRKCRRSEKMK